MKVSIPVIAYKDIDTEEFQRLCTKGVTAPKFEMFQVVLAPALMSAQLLPAVIVGVDLRDGGWFYSMRRATLAGWEATQHSEKALMPLQPLAKGK
jgi:hypothetical protein